MSAHRIIHACAASLLVAGFAAAVPASAQTKAPSDRWEYTLVPYLMGSSMDGDVTVKGQEAVVDLKSSDIFSNLDFGFMMMMAAHKGNWGYTGDVAFMALSADTERPEGEFKPDLGILAVQGTRRLSNIATLTFGLRWSHLKAELSLDDPINMDFEKKLDWVDPIVGVVLKTPEGHRWHGALVADIGGLNFSSRFTWQIFPSGGFQISPRVSVEAGWRLLETDYESGDGSSKFEYDMLYSGPVLGMAIKI